MEQCHSFLHSWQNTESVPCTDFLKRKSIWTPHASKQLQIMSWFHTNDISVRSSDPKFTHLRDANTVSNEHVISRSHPDNLVSGCDPLDLQKSDPSDPSDPDYPDHLTHFQP